MVLVCQHDAEGAFGLILNQPSDNRLSDVIEAELPEPLRRETLFGGGPVQPAALSYLHTVAGLAGANVMKNLSVGHDLEELVGVGRRAACRARQLRVFAGYAGWGPGQLDEELRRDSWLVQPATLELVFHPKPADLWRQVLLGKGDWQSRLLAGSPEDLAWN